MENYNNELYHYGVKGMKLGVRRKQPRMTYEQKVRKKMEDYHKANRGRSRRDNNTIVLKKEQRDHNIKKEAAMAVPIMGTAIATFLSSPVSIPILGASAVAALGATYVSGKRSIVLEDLMNENNIENAKRIIQV